MHSIYIEVGNTSELIGFNHGHSGHSGGVCAILGGGLLHFRMQLSHSLSKEIKACV